MARKDALLRLHQSLMARRSELRKRLGMELRDLGQTRHSSPSGDSADAAFDSSGEEITSQLAELEARELQQIERALRQLKKGTYGICEGCQCKIPVVRLNALPYSTLCIKCQREVERDADWLERRRAELGWDKVSESESRDDRDVDLTDLEMDIVR